MQVKQISVFLENKSGRLAEVTTALSLHRINIRALSIADTTDFGILRLIVDRPDRALELLRDCGFTVSATEVIAVSVPDSPGGLAVVLEVLANSTVNLEYLYAFVGKCRDNALVVFRVDDIPLALDILDKADIKVLAAEDVYNL